MNREYIYSNGKVIVKDDNNKNRMIDYHENLDEILIKENLLEEMKSKSRLLTKEVEKNKNNKKTLKFSYKIPFILTFIIPLILSLYLLKMEMFNEVVSTSIGTIPYGLQALLVSVPTSFIVGTAFAIGKYLKDKEILNDIKGKEMALKLLNNQINIELKNLNDLKNVELNNELKIDDYIKSVNDSEVLKKLKDMLIFWYDMGHDEKKYDYNYQKGTISNLVSDENQLNFVNEYYKNKEKTLIKK